MAFHVFDNSDQRAAFFICIFTTPICILVTILRFVTAKRTGRNIGLEDWLALVAFFVYMFWVAFGLWSVILQNGRNVLEPGAVPQSIMLPIIKVGYVANAFYPVNQTFAKLSLLALYYRIFSVNPTFLYMTYAIAALQVLWFIPMFFERWFLCTPVSKLWDPTIPGHCVNSQAVVAAGESVNSFIDFVMIGMAIYMVKKLKIPASSKFKLSLLFALGGFSGVIGIIKIAMVYGKVDKNGVDLPWLLIQMATSVICCCVPLHRSIIPDFHIFQTLRSTFFSSRSNSSRREGSGKVKDLSFQTIGQKSSNDRMRNADDWLPLDGYSSTRELSSRAWADTESGRSGAQEGPAYLTQTVQIHQTVSHH
ncbi:hypothetical protein F4804DRAFT_318584 [Jackrogersella minutella]|nr:hypothetical protein F4804DRAFT_318584 [Jackrogersella minutella]